MKKCPQCNRSYSDKSLNFCLDDGTVLVSSSDSKTNENIQRPTEQQTEVLSYDKATKAIKIDKQTDDLSVDNETVVRSQTAPNDSQSQIIKQGVSPMFAYLSVGLLALLILLAGAGIAYLVNSNSGTDSNAEFAASNTNSNDKTLSDIEIVGQEDSAGIDITDSANIKSKETPKKDTKETPKKDKDKGDKTEPTPKATTNPTPKPTDTPKPENGRFFVILGSYRDSSKARKRLQLARSKGLPARIINTSNVPGLRSGLKAVVMGPFSKTAARRALGRAKSVAPDAYVKAG